MTNPHQKWPTGYLRRIIMTDRFLFCRCVLTLSTLRQDPDRINLLEKAIKRLDGSYSMTPFTPRLPTLEIRPPSLYYDAERRWYNCASPGDTPFYLHVKMDSQLQRLHREATSAKVFKSRSSRGLNLNSPALCAKRESINQESKCVDFVLLNKCSCLSSCHQKENHERADILSTRKGLQKSSICTVLYVHTYIPVYASRTRGSLPVLYILLLIHHPVIISWVSLNESEWRSRVFTINVSCQGIYESFAEIPPLILSDL